MGLETQILHKLDYNEGKKIDKLSKKKAVKEERGKGLGVGGERQVDGGADICICPNACGYEIEHTKGIPCNEMRCPTCDILLIGKNIEQKEEKTMKFNKNLLSAFKKVAEAKDKNPKNAKELSTAMEEMKLVEESKAVLKLKAGEVIAYAKEAVKVEKKVEKVEKKVEKKDIKESGIYKDYFARVRDAIDVADNAFKEGDTESMLSAMQDALKEVTDCIAELQPTEAPIEMEVPVEEEPIIEPEVESKVEEKDDKKKKKDTKPKDSSLKSWAKMQDNLAKGIYKAESKEVTDAVKAIMEGSDIAQTIEKE